MRQMKTLLILLIVVLSINACALIQKPGANIGSAEPQIPKNAGTILTFNESSTTQAERQLRVIITTDFIRLDEGKAAQTFTLYDRRKGQIFQVEADEKRVKKFIKGDSRDSVPDGLANAWRIESQDSNALMRSTTNDRAPAKHHKLLLNDQACYNVVTLENILQDENIALAEYYQALASNSEVSKLEEGGSSCANAINVFDPGKRFEFGFPYREWSADGYQRFLLEYRQKIIFPDDFFEIPKSYKQVKVHKTG